MKGIRDFFSLSFCLKVSGRENEFVKRKDVRRKITHTIVEEGTIGKRTVNQMVSIKFSIRTIKLHDER